MRNKVGKVLKELRIEKGLSQAELAEKLNNEISPSAIGLWELNKRIPTIESCIILADFFNVTLDFLAGREE